VIGELGEVEESFRLVETRDRKSSAVLVGKQFCKRKRPLCEERVDRPNRPIGGLGDVVAVCGRQYLQPPLPDCLPGGMPGRCDAARVGRRTLLTSIKGKSSFKISAPMPCEITVTINCIHLQLPLLRLIHREYIQTSQLMVLDQFVS